MAALQGRLVDDDDVQRAAVEITEMVGERGLAGLVNNAGIQHVAPLDQFPVEKWDAILSINLSSAFHTMRLALPAMRQNKFGRIINIASAHGLVGSPFKSAYVAAKHAVMGITRSLANDLAKLNINVNAIVPGYMLTDMTSPRAQDPSRAPAILARIPADRWGTPEDLKGATVFLASEASSYCHGMDIAVDGAWLTR